MKNEKKYLKPDFQVIEFEKEDIILTSGEMEDPIDEGNIV